MPRSARFSRVLVIALLGALRIHVVHGQKASTIAIECPGSFTVNSFSGYAELSRTDLFIPYRGLPIDLTFSYSSARAGRDIGFGRGWSMEYACRFWQDSLGVHIRWGGGREDLFKDEGGAFIAPPGVFDQLIPLTASTFKVVKPDGTTFHFESAAHKRLTRITDRNGNQLLMTYSDSLLTAVADGSGRIITLNYTTSGRLSSIVDALEAPTRTISYGYDNAGNLVSVADAMGAVRSYAYFPNGPMNSYTDRNGNVVNLVYNENNTVKEIISCAARKSFSYDRNSNSTFVVDYRDDGEKIISKYRHDDRGNVVAMEGNCCGFHRSFEYDESNRMVRQINARGKETRYTWDDRGNLLTLRDASGNLITYTYEPLFNGLASYTDRNGHQTTYSYDGNGNVLVISLPQGVTNSFVYDGAGQMIGRTDGRGNQFAYTYDAYGNRTGRSGPLGFAETYVHDIRGRRLQSTDANGNPTHYGYDANDRLILRTDVFGNTNVLTYDANGNVIEMTDALGNTTEYRYDSFDRLVGIIDPMGGMIQVAYDSENNVTFVKDANDHVESFDYDALNRMVGYTDAVGRNYSVDYDAGGNPIGFTMPNGSVMQMAYDDLDRPVLISDGLGTMVSYGYDNEGNLTSVMNDQGHTRSYVYDGLDRIVSLTDELGGSVSHAYDGNMNVVSITDRAGNSSTFNYDALDRPTVITDRNGNSISFTYDPQGNPLTITDANGNTTAYAYDALNRRISATYPDGSTELIAYDANDNPIEWTDREGDVVTSTFDALRRLTQRTAGSYQELFTYDAAGRLIAAQNPHATVTMTYDAIDRLLSETLNGVTTQFVHDDVNARMTTVYPSGRVVVRNYDQRYRLSSIHGEGGALAEFTYDGSDRMTSLAFPGIGRQIQMGYNALGLTTSRVLEPGQQINMLMSHSLNGAKVMEMNLDAVAHSKVYNYDDGLRITGYSEGELAGGMIPNPLRSQSFVYDGVGNRLSATFNGQTVQYVSNLLNQYTAISGLGGFTPTYDLNGNLTSDSTRTYLYDHDNRLIGVQGAVQANYKYDALGRRIEKEVAGQVMRYYYGGDNVLEVRNGSNAVIETRVYGDGVDEILQVNRNGTDRYYVRDELNSVIALLGQDGSVLERYEYDPFGGVTVYNGDHDPLPSSMAGNDILFTGRELDMETGSYYLRARHLMPSLGRFKQVDPLAYGAGDVNLYTYVQNRPTAMVDPYGTAPMCMTSSPGHLLLEEMEAYERNKNTVTDVDLDGVMRAQMRLFRTRTFTPEEMLEMESRRGAIDRIKQWLREVIRSLPKEKLSPNEEKHEKWRNRMTAVGVRG